MNKKRLSLILSALVLFTLVLSLTGCPTSWYIERYAGKYSGTFTDKTDTGNWSGTIDASGRFLGTFTTGAHSFELEGNVDRRGNISAKSDSGSNIFEIKGKIKFKKVSGSWYINSVEKGTFTGKKN